MDSVFFSLRRRPDSPISLRQVPAVYRSLRALFTHRRKLLKATLHELEESRGRLPETVWKYADRRVEDMRPEILLPLAATLAGPASPSRVS